MASHSCRRNGRTRSHVLVAALGGSDGGTGAHLAASALNDSHGKDSDGVVIERRRWSLGGRPNGDPDRATSTAFIGIGVEAPLQRLQEHVVDHDSRRRKGIIWSVIRVPLPVVYLSGIEWLVTVDAPQIHAMNVRDRASPAYAPLRGLIVGRRPSNGCRKWQCLRA